MLYETSQSQVTLKLVWPVPVLSPVFLPAWFTLQQSCEQESPRTAPPGPSGALPTGVARNRLCSLGLCSDNSYTRRRKHTQSRAGGVCLSTPLLRCSQLQAIGLLCTKRPGRMAPLPGSGVPYLGRVMLVWAEQWHPGPPGPMACPWPRGDAYCHAPPEGSPCCISKSVSKLSCCSKAFPSDRKQRS